MKQQNSQQKIQKMIRIGKFEVSRKLLGWLIATLIAIPVGFYLYNYSFLSPRNYAEEAAKPLEDALVRAGAVKKCSTGDSGRGLSNRDPWYNARFETNLNEAEATALIKQVGEENGLDMKPENTPDNKSILYRDRTSKKNTYPGLIQGNVHVMIDIFDSKDSMGCLFDNPKIKYDDDNVAIGLTLNLPQFQCGAPITCNTLPW